MLNFVWTWLWDWVCLSLLSPASKTCGCCSPEMAVYVSARLFEGSDSPLVLWSSAEQQLFWRSYLRYVFYVQKQGSFIFLNFMTGDLSLEKRCRGVREGERKHHLLVGWERIPFNWQLFWKEFTGGGEGMGDKKLSGRSWRGIVYFLLVTSNRASLKVVWAGL